MRILNHLRRNRLAPIWRYQARGAIWRLVPTDFGKLLGEERDLEHKEVSFFCLNRKSGEILWKDLKFGEQWWMGIETVHRDTIYLHRFSKPDLPEHKAIIAVDLLTGSTMWINEELQFELAVGESLFASQDLLEGKLLIELDYRTGAVLRSFGSDVQVINEARAHASDTCADEVELPVPAGDPSADTSDVSAMLQKHLAGKSTVGKVEFIDHDSVIVFNFHERPRHKPGLINILQVLDKTNGTVVFGDILNADVPAIVPESFFLQDHVLYYIKDRKVLTAVPLTRSPVE